jgi:hypothetical protein
MSEIEAIKFIASVAKAVGWQAGVGGMETAGLIVSYLDEHPEKVAEFFENGSGFLIDNLIRAEDGSLTWHTQGTGEVISPVEYMKRENPSQVN